ncbi:hypothetical protein ACJJTC_014017, partial [Scirpophaga incertulas]
DHLGSNTDNTMETTAKVVTFFDELFDSVNGSPWGGKRGKLRSAVKNNSPRTDFWLKSIRELKQIKFEDNKSKFAKNAGKPRLVRVPSLEGWIVTLESFLGLSKLLFTKFGVDYFYPRYINQDPLENFFGRIRSINYRNVNPDVNTFVYAFKSLVVSNILSPHSKFANCEEDDGDTLINLNHLFSEKYSDNNKENISPNENFAVPSSSKTVQTTKESVVAEKIWVQTSAYTAGYVCRKITKKFNCKSCAQTYMTKDIQGIHKYIQYREYKRLKCNNLAYPKEQLLILYRETSQAIHNFLNDNCHTMNIKKKLLAIFEKKRYGVAWVF